MINPNDKQLLRNHANRNVTYLLDKLKVAYYDRGDGLVQSACPCKQHGGDRNNRTAWTWRMDLGKWICWSHHCEEQRGNDIFGLVSSVLGTDFPGTIKWITETLKSKSVDVQSHAADPENLYRGVTLHIHEPLSEDNLKFLQPDPQYLLDRGFDLEILRRYQVGLWSRPGTYMHDRVVFPVRDHEGHLVGYTGRTVHPPEYFEKRGLVYAKWVHSRQYNVWPKRGDLFTGSILFNLFRAKRFLEPNHTVVLVEGPLDGMRLEESGINNWVATLGTSFCHAHRTLLVQYGVKEILVAFDADDPAQYKDKKSPGDQGWKRMERIVGDLFTLRRVSPPLGNDWGDLSVEQTQQIFKGIPC